MIQILASVGLVQSLQTLSGEVLLRSTARNAAPLTRPLVSRQPRRRRRRTAVGHRRRRGLLLVATLLFEPLRAYITTRALGVPFWRFVGALIGRRPGDALMAVVARRRPAGLVAAGVAGWLRLVLLVVARRRRLPRSLSLARPRGDGGDPSASAGGSAAGAARDPLDARRRGEPHPLETV